MLESVYRTWKDTDFYDNYKNDNDSLDENEEGEEKGYEPRSEIEKQQFSLSVILTANRHESLDQVYIYISLSLSLSLSRLGLLGLLT